MRKFLGIALFSLLAISVPLAAFGQITSGNLSSTIKDSTGAVISSATITAINEDTKVSYTGSSSSNGEARIGNLPFGSYDITASAPGFKDFTLVGVRINVNKTDSETFTLATASTSSTVNVSAEAGVALDTTSLNLTQTFETKELAVLPSATVGLGVLNVSLLSPNVASSGGLGAGEGPSVAGQRPNNNNFNIEGIDNNDKGVTGPLVYIPNDAVGEFSLIVGQFSPEFGHSSGGQFNTLVKSGTNDFHGVAYEYFQNRNLNATNVPANTVEPKARYDFNRYGGQVGGPIKKNKLFFFGSYERQTTGLSSQAYVCTPTAAGIAALKGMAGLNATNLAQYLKYTPVSPGNAGIDASVDNACFNQTTGPQFLDVYPGAPTTSNPTPSYGSVPVYGSGTPTAIALGNYLAVGPYYINFKALTTSGDYTISPTDELRVRYIYNANAQQDVYAQLPEFYVTRPTKYHLVAISEYHSFTANLTNEVRLGYNRYDDTISAGSFTYPGLDSFPNLVFNDQNALQYGPDSDAPQSTIQNLYEFTDNITYSYKTHTVKIGFDGRKYIAPQTFTQRVRGDYEYNYLSEFLHDLAPTNTTNGSGIMGERSTGNFIYYGDQTALYGYANDTWRATPALTINYGIRYEFTSVPTGERAQSLNSAASVAGLISFTAPQPQYKNFAPRVGISYSVDDKTVVRAGFGMAYDVLYDNLGLFTFPPQYSSTNDVGDGNINYTGKMDPNAGDPNFLTNGGLPPGNGGLATFSSIAAQKAATSAYLPNQTLPYSEIWSLGIQRTFGSNYTAEIRYTGSRGVHLPTQVQINRQARVTAANQLPTYFGSAASSMGTSVTGYAGESNLGAIQSLSDTVPAYLAAGFTGKITSYQPDSASDYNAGSLDLIRRFNHGLSINAAYTWSKTMDDATAATYSTIFTPRRPQDSQCVSCDWSRSALDRGQRLSLAVVYDLPYFKHSNFLMKNLAGNWLISPIYIYESPEYVTVLSGTDANLNGDSVDRTIINPNGVKGTGSAVKPVYSTTLASSCGTGVTQCATNLVGYVATNPNAYYIQAGAGTLPNAARNTLPLRPIDNIDLSAVKRINFTDRYVFEFQAQAFNVLNHPQYIPGSLDNVNFNDTHTDSTAIINASSAAFNKPQTLFNSNARTMQLAAKFIF
jgi:hypothetical protein